MSSTGQIIGGIVGAVIGFYTGNPVMGAQIGMTIGGIVDPAELPPVVGPRLDEKKIQSSAYGNAMATTFGMDRIAGEVIWATDIVEHENTEEQGGKGVPTQEVTTYTYTCSFAISLGSRLLAGGAPAKGIRRIWADGHLIWDISASEGLSIRPRGMSSGRPLVGHLAGVILATLEQAGLGQTFMFYGGSEDQLPDSLIESVEGVGNVPAYRGQPYVVFGDFLLTDYGNRIPLFTFELVEDGDYVLPAPVQLAAGTALLPTGASLVHTLQLPNNEVAILSVGQEADGYHTYVSVFNGLTGALLRSGRSWKIDGSGNQVGHTSSTGSGQMFYIPIDGDPNASWLVVINDNIWDASNLFLFVADTAAFMMEWQTAGVEGRHARGFYDSTRHCLFRYPSDALAQDTVHRCSANGTALIRTVASRPLVDSLNRNSIVGGSENFHVSFTSGAVAAIAAEFEIERISPRSGLTFHAACYDAARQRYVVVSDDYLLVLEWNNGVVPTEIDSANVFEVDAVVYHPALDRIFTCRRFDGMVNQYNAETLAWERTFTTGLGTPFFLHVFDGIDDSIFMVNSGGGYYRIPVLESLAPTPPALDAVVSKICQAAGLAVAEIDVSDLAVDTVNGYTVPRAMPPRAMIEPLASAYQFDAVESGSVIKFRKRIHASVVATLTSDAIVPQNEHGTGLLSVRQQEDELPAEVTVSYSNLGADYQRGVQRNRRYSTTTKRVANVELPLVLDDQQAANLASVFTNAMWFARGKFQFSTPRGYDYVEPTDLVTVDGHTMRVLEKNLGDGVIAFSAQAADLSVMTPAAVIASPAQSVAQTIAFISPTRIFFFDLPLLRSQDDDAGLYVVASGVQGTWPGAAVYRSIDGVAYANVGVLLNAGAMGYALSALGNFPSGNIFDELNTVTVMLNSGTLASDTLENVLNGANAAVIGSEIIQYRTATLNANGTWTLSGLLRGRRGTEWAMGSHSISDAFAVINANAWERIEDSVANRGIERSYKAATLGQSLATANKYDVTNTCAALKPYSPVHIGGGRHTTTLDITIQWVRRSRLDNTWTGGASIPHGEESEAYEVDVLNGAGAVMRTLSGLSAQTAPYTKAQQDIDFPSGAPNPLSVRVYQLSATVGRGFPGAGTVGW